MTQCNHVHPFLNSWKHFFDKSLYSSYFNVLHLKNNVHEGEDQSYPVIRTIRRDLNEILSFKTFFIDYNAPLRVNSKKIGTYTLKTDTVTDRIPSVNSLSPFIIALSIYKLMNGKRFVIGPMEWIHVNLSTFNRKNNYVFPLNGSNVSIHRLEPNFVSRIFVDY